MRLVPVSVVIPTKDRPVALARALESMLASTVVPVEFVIIDASKDQQSLAEISRLFAKRAGGPVATVRPALQAGAAVQRNQAFALAQNNYILFCDDDIICEPDCIERLWNALQSDQEIGGAGVAIVNQSYRRPGVLMRMVLAAIGEAEGAGYAGRIIGPAIPFLPSLPPGDVAVSDTVPEIASVQWLNTACTLYRRRFMPDPPFDPFFFGYSIGEDIALSLRVAKRARLVNVPAARIFHDSQPGSHKDDEVARSRMEIVNRHYIMTAVMQKRGWGDDARLMLWECCQLSVCALQQRGGASFWRQLWGKLQGLYEIARYRPVKDSR
jgi:glycosyltransferase involved in cell wall biosynthesis